MTVSDSDGSYIRQLSRCFEPNAPMYQVGTPGNWDIEVVLVDARFAKKAIKWLIKGLDDTQMLGLDSESFGNKVVLLQLSCRHRCVLIRLNQGSVGVSVLNVLRDQSIRKAGAEVFGDALDLYVDHSMVINGLVNLTPYYQSGKIKLGLKAMFFKEYGLEWVKDKAITCSDWSSHFLSLHQVKYAALDAWVSYMVGSLRVHDITPVNLSHWDGRILERLGKVNRQISVMRDVQKKEFRMSGVIRVLHDTSIEVIQDRYAQKVRLGNAVKLINESGREVTGKVVIAAGKRAVLRMDGRVRNVNSEITANNYNEHDAGLDAQDTAIGKILTKGEIRSSLLEQLLMGSPGEQYETTYDPNLISTLNIFQRRAVVTALENSITAIHGPPGTGKTTTIASIAHCLTSRPNKQGVVIAARQNVAALNVLYALIKRRVQGCMLYVSEDYYVEWHEDDYNSVKEAYVVVGSNDGDLRAWQRHNPGYLRPAVLVCTTGCLNIASQGLLGALPQSLSYQLIVTISSIDKNSTLMVDECSQMWIGDIVPVLAKKRQLSRLIVVGDHKQLPPYGAKQMKEAKLPEPSLFKYCLDEPQFSSEMLTEQYRMPHTIGGFISDSFYNGALTTCYNRSLPRSVTRLSSHRVLWVNTVGEQRYSKTGSSFNLTELDNTVNLVKYFTEHFPEPQRVVVITPYDEQRSRIEAALKQVPRLHQMFNDQTIVYCIDGYQGREADIVIVSLVLSNHNGAMGFVKDKHRLNVMFSRAKLFMCVVGNYHTMQLSRRADIFASLSAISEHTTYDKIRPVVENTAPAFNVDELENFFQRLSLFGNSFQQPQVSTPVQSQPDHNEHATGFWKYICKNRLRNDQVDLLGNIYKQQYLNGRMGPKFKTILDNLISRGYISRYGQGLVYNC